MLSEKGRWIPPRFYIECIRDSENAYAFNCSTFPECLYQGLVRIVRIPREKTKVHTTFGCSQSDLVCGLQIHLLILDC
jgi:hypothetical protein